jgi:hypothetical protein
MKIPPTLVMTGLTLSFVAGPDFRPRRDDEAGARPIASSPDVFIL